MTSSQKTGHAGSNRSSNTTGRGQTRVSSEGEKAPRLPHERDESADSGAGGPSALGKVAKKDADSNRVPTDRSEASDATYRENLRGPTPGSERDGAARK